jgi:hypothetical protein
MITERPKSKLVFGAIPAHTECPFLEECSKGTMKCFVGHKGRIIALTSPAQLQEDLIFVHQRKKRKMVSN